MFWNVCNNSFPIFKFFSFLIFFDEIFSFALTFSSNLDLLILQKILRKQKKKNLKILILIFLSRTFFRRNKFSKIFLFHSVLNRMEFFSIKIRKKIYIFCFDFYDNFFAYISDICKKLLKKIIPRKEILGKETENKIMLGGSVPVNLPVRDPHP